MKIIVHSAVEKFLKRLDSHLAAETVNVIELLEIYGHNLSMPHAKPIGGGLWELRVVSKHSLRMLYGFCRDTIILLTIRSKQKTALIQGDIILAKKRFDEYCKK